MAKKPIVKFADMTKDERQLWIDFTYHELVRHTDDIMQINKDLKTAKEKYGITPRQIYVDKWIDVK